jgi:hypothetical protein
VIACPNCGEQNPERARFCLRCGPLLEEIDDFLGEETALSS